MRAVIIRNLDHLSFNLSRRGGVPLKREGEISR
jgi:hypothetical protein